MKIMHACLMTTVIEGLSRAIKQNAQNTERNQNGLRPGSSWQRAGAHLGWLLARCGSRPTRQGDLDTQSYCKIMCVNIHIHNHILSLYIYTVYIYIIIIIIKRRSGINPIPPMVIDRD